LKYFELRCIAYLKKDITFKESFNILSKYISYSMAQIDKLKELHNQKGFKHYTFSNFYPIEKKQVYKQGKNYSFTIRSLDEGFINQLSNSLRQNINNPNFLVVQIEKKVIKRFFVSELYSVTPVIVSTQKGMYWSIDRDGDIIKLQKQLNYNLEKKYRSFYGESIKSEGSFIQLLELKNRYPQSIYTKKGDRDIRFFGNKFRIIPNDDEVSQKLAFVAIACGLGEKNSFGGGFCIVK